MNLADIRDFVIVPALSRLALAQPNRVQLVLGTGLVESGYNYLDQTTPGPGPAYGFWQMEKLTHDDLWENYLAFQPSALRDSLMQMAGHFRADVIPSITTLHWNLMYASAMCAVHYRRVKAALPQIGDAASMAAYWKRWYNTPVGKGTEAKAFPFFKEACKL